MNDILTLDQLQIKRRELENELTKLQQREQELQTNLKTKEKAVIKELECVITNKKEFIQTMESQNTSLGNKLRNLKKETKNQENNTQQSPTEQNAEQPKDKVQYAIIQQTSNKTKQAKTKIAIKKEPKFFY
jgi:hypothetical protein